MSHQQHINSLNFRGDGYDGGYDYGPNSFCSPSIYHRRLSDYMNEAHYNSSRDPAKENYESSSYVSHAPPSPSEHYIVPSQLQSSSMHIDYRYRPIAGLDYISPRDKSDYGMIKDGDWSSKKNFMEGHGLGIYEPKDFERAKELLDGYRRVDTEAAGGVLSDLEDSEDSEYTPKRRYSTNESEYTDQDGSDLISDISDDECISSSQTRSGSAGGPTLSTYDSSNDSDSDNGDEEDGQRSEYSFFDDDSTDAIDYDSEAAVSDSYTDSENEYVDGGFYSDGIYDDDEY